MRALDPPPPPELRDLRLLLVDNYDSFTHNLAQLCARLTGRLPEVARNDALTLAEVIALAPDAIILSPGPGSPEVAADVGICPAIVRHLETTPILGVCLGHQVIATALGARVVPAPTPMHGRISLVHHDGTALFATLPNPLSAVRYHSLIVDPEALPPSLRATAWTHSAGGQRELLMALSHQSRALHGVQFHPESILTEAGAALLANFLALAASHKKSAAPHNPSTATHIAAHELPAALPARSVGKLRPSRYLSRVIEREVPYRDPEQAFVTLYDTARCAFWLDGNGRFSYLGESSRESIAVRGTRLERTTPTAREQRDGDPFTLLSDLLLQRSIAAPDPASTAAPFRAGWVGWLGYELKQFCEGGEGPRAATAPPDALLLLADRVLAFDHQRRTARLTALIHDGQSEPEALRWLDAEALRVAALPALAPPVPPPATSTPLRFTLDADPAAYARSVARIHELLRAGETYEICLTTQARARLPEGAPPLDPLLLHRLLRRTNPAPYSSYLRFPGGAVVSASPERFVQISPGGMIESRPIKGTRPRGATPEDDARLAEGLASSEKDRAENLMIVDLVRHDLGRVCAAGSVEVPALMEVEAHPAVFQLVSTVRGQLRPEVSPLEAVRALFPGGSMTGAPKIRAMRIIGELERAPRGVYSGGLGMIGFDGAVDLAMAIRTVLIHGDEISFGIGGAVTALSTAEDEREEALLKGRALARAVAAALGRPLADDDPFA